VHFVVYLNKKSKDKMSRLLRMFQEHLVRLKYMRNNGHISVYDLLFLVLAGMIALNIILLWRKYG